jgi:hypothetical protein
VGEYDYLHLGVLYLHKGAYEKALWAFQSQSKESELSENQYYLALTYKALQQTENFRNAILKAKELEIANAQNSQYTRE